MQLRSPTIYATAFFATLISCGQPQSESRLDDLAVDRNAKNIAVIVGAPSDLPGIDLDLNMMNEVLASTFEVRKSWKESTPKIIEHVRQAAIDAGDDGTLFFFFSGHGAENGLLLTQSGGMLNFDDITTAIKQARSRPLKRFIVAVDACFSGNLVNGTVSVGRQDNIDATVFALRTSDDSSEITMEQRAAIDSLNETMADAAAKSLSGGERASYSTQLAEQLLVIAAANRSTTSLAGSDGSTFTKGLWQAFRELSKDSKATIDTFLTKVRENTRRNSGGHHTPVYRVYPEKEVLNDLLVGSSNNSATPSIAAAISEANTNNEARLYVATDRSVTNIIVCRASRDACLASPMATVSMTISQQVINGKTLFESSSMLPLTENETYTIIGRGGANGDSVLSATAVQFRAK